MPLEERLELSIDDALARIDQAGQVIEDRFGEAATSFKVALAEALDVLKTVQPVDITADASAVTTDVTAAVQAADTSPVITADTAEIPIAIDQALADTNGSVVTTADTSAIGPAVDQAVANVDATVVPIADTSGLATQIDAAVAAVQPEPIPIEVDTSQIDAALSDTSEKATDLTHSATDAADGLGAIAPAAALATGELGSAQEIISKLTPETAGAAAATAGLALAGKSLFDAALEQNTALARLREQFGPLADAIEHVNVGGLNESLDHLATRTGANIAGLQDFAASFGQLGKSAGDSTPHIAEMATTINALAARASVLNPSLGTADQIVQQLSNSLSRGGRFLAAYGISLSTAQINAEALRETGKATTAQLTTYDKTVAGATLATQQLGISLGSDINNGAQKAEVQLRALKAAFEETITKAGAALVQPSIDAFKDLEPVLAEVATLLGVSLAAALHVVGPLLSLLATVVQAIPGPVLAAVAAFVILQRILPALSFEAVLTFFTALPAKAAAGTASLLGFGAAAETTTAEVAGSGGLGAAFAGLSLGSLALAGAVLVAVSAAQSHSKELSNEKKAAEDAAAAIRSSGGDLRAAAADGNFLNSALKTIGESTSSFQSQLARFGLTTADVADELSGTATGVTTFSRVLGEAAARGGDAGKAANLLLGEEFQLSQQLAQGAHDALSNAVATGELSRQHEVLAIRQHTLTDGTVDWIGVLHQLQPTLNQAARDAQLYGDATTKAADTDPVVAAQDKMRQAIAQAGNNFEQALVFSRRYTQSQIDIANALNTNKDGTIDYAKALDALSPGLGAVSIADGQLAGGLDTTATKFAAASAQAKVFQTALDELLNPVLNASDADVKWHQELDSLAAALAKNGNTVDLNTKAGQENVSTVNSLVRAGTDLIDKLIAEGAATDVVNAKKAEVIAKLRDEEVHYPALKTLIDEYIAKILAIPPEQLTNTGLPNAAQSQIDAIAVANAVQAIPPSWKTDYFLDVRDAFLKLQTLAQQIEFVNRLFANSPFATNFASQPGEPGFARQAGGPVWPGEWTVGEAGPEKLFLFQGGTGFVVPQASPASAAPSSGPQIDYERLARAIAAVRPNVISVTEVAQNPQATAAAVDARLGARVNF